MTAKRTDISTREGLIFGAMMLGQVSGILVGTTLLGLLADHFLQTAPLGLAIAAVAGGLWATVVVLVKVTRKLKE
jgi:F0F1-type ATP synthase assembly protein I